MERNTKESKKALVIQAFMNHCAIIIQSHFKGYRQRKLYRKFLPLYKRFKQLMCACFIGWKTRKILKLNVVKNKINEIKFLKSQQKNLQLRISKRDFTDEISRLLKNGLWLYYYSKQRKIPLAQKAIANKNQAVLVKKIDLKQAFNIIPKGNTKKIIQNDEKTKASEKISKKEKVKDLAVSIKIESNKSQSKQKKVKKFEDPPKRADKKRQKRKEVNLEIDAEIEPQNKLNSISCETPNCSTNQLKQFMFHTRPRDQLPANRKSIQFGKGDAEEPFKQVHVFRNPYRKGLNMTLSKKIHEEKLPESTPINLDVLQDFTKKKIPEPSISESNRPSLDLKEVSNFTMMEEKIGSNQLLQQKLQPLQSGRSLNLQMKKEAFEKRKIQFEKKSREFKTVALK